MEYTISLLKHTLTILVNDLYPDVERLKESHYSLEDLVDQVLFELIKEEYKKHAPRQTIQHYLGLYDVDGSNRKYTRAIQYTQHNRDENNSWIEDSFGFKMSELEAQDVSGAHTFSGHKFTAQEFWGLKMQAECSLLNKMHGHQIDNSKNVSETIFKQLFQEYSDTIDELEPAMNVLEQVVDRTYAYYGLETHFLTEFFYRLTLAAEEVGFPQEIPVSRILAVSSIDTIIPATGWCPEVYMADFCMLLKWDSYCKDVFVDSEEQWLRKEVLLWDCKQIKNIILQRKLDKWLDYIHACTLQDKVDFIIERYWIWDKRPEYEWTSERIQYYRKLHKVCTRSFASKPHIK